VNPAALIMPRRRFRKELIIIGIVLVLAFQPTISYTLDLLMEVLSPDHHVMGEVRTLFLTAWNLGALAAPLLLGAVLVDTPAYEYIFIAAAVMLMPFIVILAVREFPKTLGPRLSHVKETLICIARSPDLSSVTFAHFLLYLFYVWAPFYVPLYLHSELGLPWTTLGWVFAVMLLPYVILEYPAGWLADHYLGDKELLFVGFVIAGGSLAAIGTFTSQTPTWALLAILVLSRVGTALIEAMTEGHFYRRVSAEDINSMSLFRSVWPLSFVVGPVVASALLSITNFQTFLFVAGGFIAVAGVMTTLRIRDFR
jgi:MFS family permease